MPVTIRSVDAPVVTVYTAAVNPIEVPSAVEGLLCEVGRTDTGAFYFQVFRPDGEKSRFVAGQGGDGELPDLGSLLLATRQWVKWSEAREALVTLASRGEQ